MTCQVPFSLRLSAKALVTSAALLIAGASVRANTPDKLLEMGNQCDIQLDAAQALKYYKELEALQPDNADVHVRIARQYRHLMADAGSNSEKMKLGNLALEHGKKAAALAPNNSDAQLSCAISYGKMVPLLGKKEQVACSKLIKEGAEKAIKLNASNDLAWHILGRWHRSVASVSGVKKTLAAMVYDSLPEASNEEAVNCLRKAVKLNPKRLMHFIELGRAYAQMGYPDEARVYIKRGLSMPSREKDDNAVKEGGREALEDLD